jgi:dTDP-4-dehydrorhamnose 3,5-epimerase
MKISSLSISDIKILEPTVYNDNRGFFLESFNEKFFNSSISGNFHFVQDNHSKSKKGVLRGMHYQVNPFEQGKLVRVISGEVYDVALDIRRNSTTYGKWVSEILSAENKKQLWIPPGFAHGFLTLSNQAELLYKTTNYYSKEHERLIKFNDSSFNIKWPKLDIDFTFSEKDS